MILGLCCVRNCEPWFDQVLSAHLRICDRVLVLDDGSTDKTGDIAISFSRVHYWRQDGLPRNEARDRNFIFDKAHALKPDWCWWFDGDETVWHGSRKDIESVPPHVNTLVTQLINLWGDAEHYAADWSIQKFHIFRYISEVCLGYRWTGRGKHEIHCGARPRTAEYEDHRHRAGVPIVELHWGWMNRAACDEKLACYRKWDPGYKTFRGYRKHESAPRVVRPLSEWGK